MKWQPLDSIGISCNHCYIRTTRSMTLDNMQTNVDRVSLPAGAVGYCYAAKAGLIHVGFTKDFTPKKEFSPTAYPYCVTFNFRDIPKLEISS